MSWRLINQSRFDNEPQGEYEELFPTHYTYPADQPWPEHVLVWFSKPGSNLR